MSMEKINMDGVGNNKFGNLWKEAKQYGDTKEDIAKVGFEYHNEEYEKEIKRLEDDIVKRKQQINDLINDPAKKSHIPDIERIIENEEKQIETIKNAIENSNK